MEVLRTYLCIMLVLPVHVSLVAQQPGDLDSTFGVNGIVVTDFTGKTDQAFAVAIQMDAKIVVAGCSSNGINHDFALVRYDLDGTIDSTFGVNGKVLTPVGSKDDYAAAVAIQADGKIVAAGSSHNGSDFDIALVRYKEDGAIDSTFGINGRVTTDIGGNDDNGAALAIQPDNRIVVAGTTNNGFSNSMAVVRYNPNGVMDSSFGNGGSLTTSFPNYDDVDGMALCVQPDGKIIVAGTAQTWLLNDNFAIARYKTDGTLDSTFGNAGRVNFGFGSFGGNNDHARSMALQPDGRILVAGYTDIGIGDEVFAVARLAVDGRLDSSFGVHGRSMTNFGTGEDYGQSVAIQPDGKIVVAGWSGHGNSSDIGVARYNGNGKLDPSFGGGGQLTTDLGTSADGAHAVAIQADGRILVVGYTAPFAGLSDFALARFISACPPTAVDATVTQSGSMLIANATEARYQWVDCEDGLKEIVGADRQSFTPLRNGIYAVIVDQNSCIDTSDCHEVTSVGLGSHSERDLLIYPNPTKGNLAISLGSTWQEVDLEISNVLGRSVGRAKQYITDQCDIVIDAPVGNYFLTIRRETGESWHAIVIKE